MAERYTFRTTRKTAWLDDILMAVDKQDRSDFIREHLILGLKGVVPQTSDKPQTIVQPTSNERPTIVTQPVTPTVAPTLAVKRVEDDDLDEKLLGKF